MIRGTAVARRLGLNATGTLGVLASAAERGLVSLSAVFDRLQRTTFRADPALYQRLLARDAARRGV